MNQDHPPAPGDEPSTGECVASRYVGVADSYNGSAFCGCDNCIEYVAEHEYEDLA